MRKNFIFTAVMAIALMAAGQALALGDNINTIHDTNTATGGNGGAGGHATATALGGIATQHQGQSQGQGQGQQQGQVGIGSGNRTDIEQNYQAQKRNPVASAASTFLTASEDTCMGSGGLGAQAVGFGLSFGKTWTDDDCVRRKNARELRTFGKNKAALALLCQNPDVAAAMEVEGGCPGGAVHLSKDSAPLRDSARSEPRRESSYPAFSRAIDHN